MTALDFNSNGLNTERPVGVFSVFDGRPSSGTPEQTRTEQPYTVQDAHAKRGMSLIAKLAIVAGVLCVPLIVLLVMIVASAISDSRAKAQETASMANLTALGSAVRQYEHKHHKLPPTDTITNFKAAVVPFLKTQAGEDPFTQPGTDKTYVLDPYLSGQQPASQGNSQIFLVREAVPNSHGQIGILFGDSHVAVQHVSASKSI